VPPRNHHGPRRRFRPHHRPPRKPSGGALLEIVCALVIAYSLGHSSSGSVEQELPATVFASTGVAPSSVPQAVGDEVTPIETDRASEDVAQDEVSSNDDDADSVSYASSGSCTADYYLSSSGDCVHRPIAAAAAPDGASARCYDGTYSFSEHRRGTCSHHGGVEEWL
jgi:hypothetical protein